MRGQGIILLDKQKMIKQIDRWLGKPLCLLLGAGSRRRHCEPLKIQPEHFRKILVIKLAALGDSVLLIPALRALRQRFPAAHLVLLAGSASSPVLERCPYIDELQRLNLEKTFLSPLAAWNFIRALRQRRFDCTIDFEQWMRATAMITWMTGAPVRLGFDTRHQGRSGAFTHTFRPPRNRHELDNFLSLVERISQHPLEDRSLELWLSPDDLVSAQALLMHSSCPLMGQGTHRSEAFPALDVESHPWVALHPGCGSDGGRREWPPERYSQLGDRLCQAFGVRILITGSEEEIGLAEKVADGMSEPTLLLAGKLSLTQLAAVLKSCHVLVCGNTGVMHVAAAVGTPTVALHGPTNPLKWGPVGSRHRILKSSFDCSPCLELGFEYACQDNRCMKSIEVDRVYEAVESLLTEKGESR